MKLFRKQNIEAWKDDVRKIGINLITAAMVSSFITNVVTPALRYKAAVASLFVFVSGILLIFFGNYQGRE